MLSKWMIGTFSVCVLIYIGMCHIGDISHFFLKLFGLMKPMLIGAMLALILNIPMEFWAKVLRRRTKLDKRVRPVAILLALVCVCGIFAGVALLVLPELVEAVQIVGNALSQISQMEIDPGFYDTSLGRFVDGLDIDWLSLKSEAETWIRTKSGAAVEQALGIAKTMVSSVVSLAVGLVFAVYILSGKEKLKRQGGRLLRVWLPTKVSETILHVWKVCNAVFHQFVVGQTLEAIILGTLCMTGMFLLRLPYAPMVGALVGVTALIPIVGAFIGTIVGAFMIMTVSPVKALIFVVFLLALQQVEGNLIYPRVVGSKLRLPALWVLAAVTIGGNLAGPLGMLLGVPAASAGYALIREATDQREQRCERKLVREN